MARTFCNHARRGCPSSPSPAFSAAVFLFQAFGRHIGYLPLAAVAAAATALLLALLWAIKPEKFED